jgi:hypothetical protein
MEVDRWAWRLVRHTNLYQLSLVLTRHNLTCVTSSGRTSHEYVVGEPVASSGRTALQVLKALQILIYLDSVPAIGPGNNGKGK